jgi:septal ring factor EnvC (AmiA/AmiB activator)
MGNDRIDLLERDVATLKSEVAMLKSVYVKSYEMRISRVEADIAQLKADVAMLKAELLLLRADVTQLQKDVAGILAQLPHLPTRLDVKSSENRTRTWFFAGFLSLFTLQLAIPSVFIGSR